MNFGGLKLTVVSRKRRRRRAWWWLVVVKRERWMVLFSFSLSVGLNNRKMGCVEGWMFASNRTSSVPHGRASTDINLDGSIISLTWCCVSLIFFLPTLYCICQRSGTIEKERGGGIETDRCVCVCWLSFTAWLWEFRSRGRGKRDSGRTTADRNVDAENVADMSSKLSRSLACVLCMWCYLTIFLLRLLCVVVDKRQQERRGKEKALRERPLSHASFSLQTSSRSVLSFGSSRQGIPEFGNIFRWGVSTHMTVFSFGIFFFRLGGIWCVRGLFKPMSHSCPGFKRAVD